MRSNACPRRLFLQAVTLVVPLLLLGCAPKIKGWSQESYRSPGFDSQALTQEHLALLPVIILEHPLERTRATDARLSASAPYTSQTAPADPAETAPINAHGAYRITLGELLLSKIQSRRPTLRLVPPNDALKRLNDAGLTGDYRDFHREFSKVGLDGSLLKKFGKALNCRYLFITQAVVTESKSDASLNIVWSFGRQSLLRSVKIYGQIWDAVSGQQVWEGSGVGYTRLIAYEGAPLPEEMASQAVDSLLQTIMP